MSRKIIIASAITNGAKRVESEATTWAELQQNETVASLLTGGVEAIMKPGNVVLRNDSTLPEGDFNVYLVATKNKSGYDDDDFQELEEALVYAIEAAADKIVAAIQSNSGNTAVNEDAELKAAVQEAKSL